MANPNQHYYQGENYSPQYNGNTYDQGQHDAGYEDIDYVPNESYYEGNHGGDQQLQFHHDFDHDGTTTNETVYTESVPDIFYLVHYCANTSSARDSSKERRLEVEETWESIREWLKTHSEEDIRASAEQRGDSSMTALHFACRNNPPLDIVETIISSTVEPVQWPDDFGWLPIHYACACGADTEIIKCIAETYPESKTTLDRRGRSPLHFALGNSNPENPVSPNVVVILSSSGAASYADDNGMFPLHYACAYGASEECLFVLADAYDEAITTIDRHGRTPLHFALSNAGRKAAPAAVRLLLELNKDIVNSKGNGPLPLRVLAEYASTVRKDDERCETVQKCLEYLLEAEPDPTADFFTALQSLPDWLQEQAVVMPVVQILLNEKISGFPTGILMLDFYVQIFVIIIYFYLVPKYIDSRVTNNAGNEQEIIEKYVWTLYVGASYFLIREIIKITSLISLKSFHIWFYDGSNWLNVAYIFIVGFWANRMDNNDLDQNLSFFQTGAALSIIILWLKFLSYLRNILIDFAVFVGGVFYVVRRLAAFLSALAIILIAFSQMFYTIFRGSESCIGSDEEIIDIRQLRCEDIDKFPYCNMWDTFLSVLTMLLGEVDEELFLGSSSGIALFIVFMFMVVILLANVLIAIVTDSYKVIQDQRAAVVFWTNRLDFIAEMDAIANGPWKTRLKQFFRIQKFDDNDEQSNNDRIEVTNSFGYELWKHLIDLLEDEVETPYMSLEFCCIVLLRIAVVFFVIPIWMLLGLVTAGWLWPPQMRDWTFTSRVFKHSSDSEMEDELRRTQMTRLKQEVEALKDDLVQELAIDRTQMVQFKSLVSQRKVEIQNEMKDIKRVVHMLFEKLATS